MDVPLKITLQNLPAVKEGTNVSKGIQNQMEKTVLPLHKSMVHLHHEHHTLF